MDYAAKLTVEFVVMLDVLRMLEAFMFLTSSLAVKVCSKNVYLCNLSSHCFKFQMRYTNSSGMTKDSL